MSHVVESNARGAGPYTRGPHESGGDVVSLSFQVQATSGRARAGLLQTAHGPVETPVFMPVGTAGAVKAVTPRGWERVSSGSRMATFAAAFGSPHAILA